MRSINTNKRQILKLGIACFLVIVQVQNVFSIEVIATPETLATINAEVVPGTTVILGNGTYTTQIRPVVSGTEEDPIIYKAAEGASPLIQESPAIFLRNLSYIKVDGLNFLNCTQFVRMSECSNITIENCHFENSVGWESCSLKKMGDYITFKNNTFINGTDLLTIQGGNYHLIEGNTFHTASHTCLVFMGVQYSVIRGNRFINPSQKLLEIFATRDREWSGPYRKSEHILIENNIFGPNSHDSSDPENEGSASWGTQFAGVKCIMRNNIFAGCEGGMDFTGYGSIDGTGDSPEAVFNNTNRVYSNTLYSNGQRGRYSSGPGILISHNIYTEFYDNIFMNNIFYANRAFADATYSQDDPNVQIAFNSSGEPSEVGFYYNNIMSENGEDENVFLLNESEEGYTLEAFEAAYYKYIQNNIQGNPMFENETPDLTYIDRLDYVLKENSPCIDAGGYLLHMMFDGEGKILKVQDPYFFSDGFGLVKGDVIQLEGQTERATILSVDYEKSLLTLNKTLSWTKGQGVSMRYGGAGPDIGANEHGEWLTSISEDLAVPASLELSSYPNPFLSSTTVYYELPEATDVELVVYDITGKKVAQLVSGYQAAGSHTLTWDKHNYLSSQEGSELYLLRLQTRDCVKTIKILSVQ